MRSRMREDVADGRDGSLTDQYCGRTELLLTDPVSIAETWWGLQIFRCRLRPTFGRLSTELASSCGIGSVRTNSDLKLEFDG